LCWLSFSAKHAVAALKGRGISLRARFSPSLFHFEPIIILVKYACPGATISTGLLHKTLNLGLLCRLQLLQLLALLPDRSAPRPRATISCS